MAAARGASTSLISLLAERAGATPDRVSITVGDDPVTFAGLADAAAAVAAGLADLGVGAGDRVAIYMANDRAFVEAWLGAMALGALAVPINIGYRGDFLRHQLVHSGAVVAVVDAQRSAALAEVRSGCGGLRAVVVAGGDGATGTGTDVPFAALFGHGRAPLLGGTEGDPATILYTSGTTGLSKGVVMSHRYLLTLGGVFTDAMALCPDDVLYIPLPLFHLGGLSAVLTSLIAGSASVIEPHFSVSATWDRVRHFGATGTLMVGPMIAMLWQLPEEASDATLPLRVLGGAPIPSGLEPALRARYHCDLVTMYGMTEAFPLAIAPAGAPFPTGAAGRRNPAFDVRLVDDDGNDVPVGTTGEFICRPHDDHTMFEGYFADEVATAAAIRDGWFHTGDLGREDDDGYLFFVDRQKDAIRRRGENISTFEVEAAIRRHPAVADVAVHGVPSDLGEDDVKAVIVVKGEAPPSYEELDAFFTNHLPKFAIPRYVEFVADLPRNQVGRVLKYELRRRGVDETMWDRERTPPTNAGAHR